MPDLDEPVSVDLEPEEALRLLLGEERRDEDPSVRETDSEESPQDR